MHRNGRRAGDTALGVLCFGRRQIIWRKDERRLVSSRSNLPDAASTKMVQQISAEELGQGEP